MKKFLLILALSSCAHPGPMQTERVLMVSPRALHAVYFCSYGDDMGVLACDDARPYVKLIIQQMPQQQIDAIRLGAPTIQE